MFSKQSKTNIDVVKTNINMVVERPYNRMLRIRTILC